MDKRKLAKNGAVALGFMGLAIAAPHLIPALALASKDYFGEIFSALFSDGVAEDSLGKIGVNVLSGVFTELAASATEKLPEALSREDNLHLESALATAYLESLDALSLKIQERGDNTLRDQSHSALPLLKARIERALKEQSPDLLFLVQEDSSARTLTTEQAYANRLSAEDFVLSLSDTDRMKEMIAGDTEIALRRWLNEERAYRQGTLGIGRDAPLPEPLCSYLRDELVLEIPHRMGEVVRRDDYNKSWIAFQQAHLQAVLHTVNKIEGSHQALSQKIEEVARLSGLVEEMAAKLGEFLSNARLPQDELDRLLQGYRNDLVALEGRLYRKIDESTERLIREGSEIEGRLSDLIEGGKEEILEAIRTGEVAIPTTRLRQLPPPSRVFTGREKELTELIAQSRRGVTISGIRGMGGVGKTSLALKLADIIKSDYPDAQFYLDLKGVSPPAETGATQEPLKPVDVMWHVISSYQPEAKRSNKEEEIRAWYFSLLEGQRALLLLDNAKDAEQIDPLVPPESCYLIVTSRRHFALSGMYDLNLEKLPPEDAEKLLLRIAPRIGDHSGQIAKQCDYLPLALDLAAKALAKRRTLTPDDLTVQLQDRQSRLGLVEASFSLSYDLLSAEQQRLWRTLAVFPDSFDDNAAASLWEISIGDAKNVLAELDGYSLLEWNEATERFRLHDLARDFADVRLSEAERHGAHRNHSKHYLQVLSAAKDLYRQGHGGVAQGLALFDLEQINIETGQAWVAGNFEQHSEAASLAVKYALDGDLILGLRHHPDEFIRWQEAALSAARKLNARKEECDCLNNLGLAYSRKGEPKKALAYHEQALEIARELDDQKGVEMTLGNIGSDYKELSDYEKAIEYHRQALPISRALGDKKAEGANLNNMANAYAELGYVKEAVGYLEEALAIARETGDRRGESIRISNLGSAYTDIGEYDKAIQCHEKSLAISRELGDRRGEAADLGNLGLVFAEMGEFAKAAAHHEQALIIAREVGDKNGESSDLGNLGTAYFRLGRVEEAIGCYEQSIAIARDTGNMQIVVNQLGNMGIVYAELGQTEKAIELIEESLNLSRQIGSKEGEGNQLSGLGDIYSRLGNTERAIELYEASLSIFEQTGSPNANVVRRELEQLRAGKGNSNDDV